MRHTCIGDIPNGGNAIIDVRSNTIQLIDIHRIGTIDTSTHILDNIATHIHSCTFSHCNALAHIDIIHINVVRQLDLNAIGSGCGDDVFIASNRHSVAQLAVDRRTTVRTEVQTFIQSGVDIGNISGVLGHFLIGRVQLATVNRIGTG